MKNSESTSRSSQSRWWSGLRRFGPMQNSGDMSISLVKSHFVVTCVIGLKLPSVVFHIPTELSMKALRNPLISSGNSRIPVWGPESQALLSSVHSVHSLVGLVLQSRVSALSHLYNSPNNNLGYNKSKVHLAKFSNNKWLLTLDLTALFKIRRLLFQPRMYDDEECFFCHLLPQSCCGLFVIHLQMHMV